MIIHPLDIGTCGQGVRRSARIEFESSNAPHSGTLWYEFPLNAEEHFSGSADGFVAGLLLLAMTLREDVRVRGALNRGFVNNLNRYQCVFSAWFPERFSPVAIECEQWSDESDRGAGLSVGAAFSGGVDSSFTLFSHLPRRTGGPGFPIDYALFVHGFDIPLQDEETFATAFRRYRRDLRELGVDLLVARTNLRRFVDSGSWELMHGSALASVALMLDRMLGLFYVPASFPYTDLHPWGSHPLTDPLLSTDSLQIVHDGCMPRVDKIARVVEHPPAREWLRVCWKQPNAHRNCCQCYTCILTMASLEIAGVLRDCRTFPEALERSRIRAMRLPIEEFRETERLAERARAAGRLDLAEDLTLALRLSRRSLAISEAGRRLRALIRFLRRRAGVGLGGRVRLPGQS